MSKKDRKGLVPELRFPEFRGSGNWEAAFLGDLGTFTGGGTPSKTETKYWQGDIPWISSSDISDESINDVTITRFITKEAIKNSATKLIPSGSILLVSRVGVGKLAIIEKPVCTSQDFTNLTPSKDSSMFLGYYLKANNQILENLCQGMAIKGFTKDDISKLMLCVPELEEQQKIADFLSSLDELITAHTQKHQALQSYKKGLMQSLFPAEGESIPVLRFPEFRKSGEWKLKPFFEAIKLYRGSSPRPIKQYLTKNESGINWIKIGDTSSVFDFIIRSVSEKITPEGAEKSRKVKKGELILANSMSYGATYQLELDGCIYDGWFVLREYEDVFDRQFLLQLLNSTYMQEQYKKLAAGGIVQNISSEIVYSTLLPKPSIKEQQRIADCLSSVDDLISAQVQKIEELKAYKKGLMQQLFPVMGEVSV